MTWALAGPAAEFYEQEILRQLLPAVGLTAFLQGFLSTKVVTAQRHLMLGRATVLELGSQAVGIVVTIGLAMIWPSVWVIVVGGIIGMCSKVALSHFYFPGPANRFQFERSAFGELFNFGKFIFLSSICGFLINNGDRAILGKFVSLTELALYNIAFFFASVPLLLTMRLVNQVMMPLYRERPTEASAENRRDIAKARAMITGTMMRADPCVLCHCCAARSDDHQLFDLADGTWQFTRLFPDPAVHRHRTDCCTVFWRWPLRYCRCDLCPDRCRHRDLSVDPCDVASVSGLGPAPRYRLWSDCVDDRSVGLHPEIQRIERISGLDPSCIERANLT